QNIAVGTPAANGNNLPPTFNNTISPVHAGVWYTLVGTGSNVRVTTCGGGTDPCFPSATTFDTYIAVYCGSSCADLKAITGNDDDPPATCAINAGSPPVGASAVTFSTVAGQPYYIYVKGVAGATGSFWISATPGAASPGAPVCSAAVVPPCTVVPPAIPGPT